MGINYTLKDAYYGNHKHDTTMPPERKRWFFTIDFIDDKGKARIINGQIIAAGAGSVKQPLDRYDIVVTLD